MRLSVVILPTPRWSEVRPHWTRAEEFGLYAGYTYDHLSWRSFRDKAWFNMVPTLVAAATATNSIRLGPLVTTPNFRHPLVLAKDLLALDDISNGRSIVGDRHQRAESDEVGAGRRRDQRRHHVEPRLVAKAAPRQVVVGVARVETELLRARPVRSYL